MLDRATRLLEGLNPSQQEAVTTTEGPVLVVAGPGSGKTRVLTHRIAYLIEEQGISADQILAVTFTNKAAREMRDRVDRLLGGGSAAGLVMGTFHALGVRILRQNPGLVADRIGLLPNFLIYDDADQLELAKRSVVAIGLDPKQLVPRRMLSRISAAKSMLLSPDEVANEATTYDDELVVRVYREYERTLRGANAVDFDDLLGLPIRLFDEVPQLLENYQRRFRYILVDEYQDTNRVQYVLVTALAAHFRNLFVVGDPDQSIYAWRQADIRNILDFEKDYPDAKQIHLELNYRSTGRIVQAADRVIRDNTQRIDRRIRTENVEGELIALRELADQNHEASFIVGEIRRLMAPGKLTGNDFAVMYRTTAQSRVLEEAFRNSDIPYRIVGGVRFYSRKEVKDILAVLRLLHNPSDRISLERVLDNLPLGRGFGPKALETVLEWAADYRRPVLDAFVAMAPAVTVLESEAKPSLGGAAKAAAERIGNVFGKLIEQERSSTLPELFDNVVELTGYRDTFNEANEEELQRWANVLELRSDLERYETMEPGRALAAYLEQVALVSDVDGMEDDARGQVTLITLHSAKGLEFPVVFIAGVEEGLLPINRAVEAEPFDPAPMEEERRLFYVGITRAQHLLYITYAGNRMTYGSYRAGVASRFVHSIPAETVRSITRPSAFSGSASRASGHSSGPLASRVTSAWMSGESETWRQVAAPARAVPRYEAGQRVFHAKFGEGTIAEVLDRKDDQEVAIEFLRHGRKRLMASLAPLDVVSSDSG
jgi:DNA helicase II / ATP-dependent DNA helicase PcrA